MTVNCDSIWLNRHSSCHGLALTLILKRLKSPKGSWKRNSLEVYSLPLFCPDRSQRSNFVVHECRLITLSSVACHTAFCFDSHCTPSHLTSWSLINLWFTDDVIFLFFLRFQTKFFFTKLPYDFAKAKTSIFCQSKKCHIATYLHKALSVISV